MATRTAEKEIVELEKQFWQALKDGDVETALALTDDPCIVTGAQGIGSVDHETFRSMMEDAPWTIDQFELGDDFEVKMVGDDVAIVAYKVKEELTVDGAPISLEAADASTWVRRNNRWVCALHTESITGDPYGRDRKRIK
jgi:ketosteroid isomerase-like protein